MIKKNQLKAANKSSCCRKALVVVLTIFPLVFADATISVDWNTVKYAVNPLSYSICGSYAYQASQTTNAGYRDGMKYAIGQPNGSTALLRLHRQAIVGAWSPGGTWNANTVTSALTPLINDGFVIMIDFDRAIGGNAMDIAPADAANLVRIVNVTGKLGVKYWEIFNENAGDGASRGTQVKACSQAMKAVDSTIKVGGPALSYLDQNFFSAFATSGLPDIDFVTFHGYQGGSTSTVSDATIYDWAWGMGSGIKQLRTMLDQKSPNKHISIFWDEYNISWDWTTVDPRTTSNKGGVFSALAMVTNVDNGGDVSNRWNESEPSFAVMTSAGAPYTVAHVYHLFNQFCYGSEVTATTSDAKSVVAFPVKDAAHHTLVLINRSATQQTANVTFTGWNPASAFNRYQVWTKNGIDTSTAAWTSGSNAVVLPDNSVTFLTIADGTAVKPQIKRDIAVQSLNGPVTVGIYSVSGQLLSKFVVANSKGNLSVDAITQTAQRALPRAFGHGAYFITLKTPLQQLHKGPFLSCPHD
jgi:xylan 1,4-beta-xylosidase